MSMTADSVARLRALEDFVRERIAPTVLSHGGAVEIVRFEADVVELTLSGACSACSLEVLSSERISEYLFERFPWLADVVVHDQVEWQGEAAPVPALTDLLPRS